jgi:hypothetical protein
MAEFIYEVKTMGPKKSIVVYQNGTSIYNGVPSAFASEDTLKQEAINTLQDSYPGVTSMVSKDSTAATTSNAPEPAPADPPPAEEPAIEPEPEPTVVESPADTEPEYQYSPPAGDTLNANPLSNQKGVKNRIYNVFKPTVMLDELSLPISDDRKEKKSEDMASLQYPLIKINNYIISEVELEYVNIDCTEFLPTITVQATFLNNKFIDAEMPKDGDIISIGIRNKTDALNMIRNDYVITGVTPTRRKSSGTVPISVTFFGELFVPGLKSYLGSESYKGTVMNVLKIVAKELELGFNTNDDDTDDNQIWLSTDSPEDFINTTVKRAWKNEDSFYDVWIDIYYNLNFVNVQNQLLSAEDNVDEAAVLHNVDTDWTFGPETEQTKTALTPKVFSNYIGYRTSSFYINEWKPINKSSSVTFMYGASIYASFFEHVNSLYEDAESQKYWNIQINPNYDQEKINNHILLRGRAKYDKDVNKGELARANYNYQDIYSKAPWMGIQYTITNPEDDNSLWTGNHHKNYLRAQVHNAINMAELEKLNLEIQVQGTNTNIIKGDKIPVIIIGTDPVENQLVDQNALARDKKNLFYSGWYLVKGFNLRWANRACNDSFMSNFSQTFILTRREWPPPVPVESVPTNATNVNL